MNETILTVLITAIVTLLTGSGGLFAYLQYKKKASIEAEQSSAEEWHTLYNEMKERLEAQDLANKRLSEEVRELKVQLSRLTVELEGYKKFDHYVNELEVYTNTVLQALKPLVTEEAYDSILDKRPYRRELSH